MNKKYLGIVIVAVVVVFAIIMIKKNNTVSTVVSENNTPVTETQTTGSVKTEVTTGSTTTTTTTPVTKTFTLADVMTHNTEADCYSAIDGKVYDLTAWIKKHPGGDRNILRICGLDGSSAFNGQHGGESKPERILAGFEVGILK